MFYISFIMVPNARRPRATASGQASDCYTKYCYQSAWQGGLYEVLLGASSEATPYPLFLKIFHLVRFHLQIPFSPCVGIKTRFGAQMTEKIFGLF